MTVHTAILILSALPLLLAITCYECTSSEGQDCKYTAKSCAYGFFGCVKMAIYAGGVDRLGNWENDQERRIVSMMRGCALIPFGHIEMCTQVPMLGYRLQRCTCFNDYCNSTARIWPFTVLIILLYSIV